MRHMIVHAGQHLPIKAVSMTRNQLYHVAPCCDLHGHVQPTSKNDPRAEQSLAMIRAMHKESCLYSVVNVMQSKVTSAFVHRTFPFQTSFLRIFEFHHNTVVPYIDDSYCSCGKEFLYNNCCTTRSVKGIHCWSIPTTFAASSTSTTSPWVSTDIHPLRHTHQTCSTAF
jgi:hypothetical protein